MTTALQIVNGAAEHIGLRTAETDLEAFEFQSILEHERFINGVGR